MCKKGRVLHMIVTLCTLAILITVGGDISFAEAKNEVRSVASPSYVQSRPTYTKPKPKLVLPKQLQQQKSTEAESQSLKKENGSGVGSNPNLVTQTVYGFLDFVTTVGNTVMIFTPQTKKAEVVVTPASSVRETVLLQPTAGVESVTLENPKTSNQRTGRLLDVNLEESSTLLSSSQELEPSEYEPQVFPTPVISTPSSALDLGFIDLVTDMKSSLTITNSIVTAEPEVRTEVNVMAAVKASESISSKAFTLKFPRPAATPTLIVNRKSKEEFQTGLVSHNVESKVTNGVTTVHETKILGTFIGTNYARILESSSTILPVVITASTPTTSTVTTTKMSQKVPGTESIEVVTALSVSSSGDIENDPRFNSELLENEEGPDEMLAAAETGSSTSQPTPILIVASRSEQSTHYFSPEKESRAQVYASPIPSPNAYSRQAQIYVDVSPASAFDYIVTATPSRKPFRPNQNSRSTETSSKLTNRFKNTPPTSTESNELVVSSEPVVDDASRRGGSRFRNARNRQKNKQIIEADILPSTVNVAATTPASGRKFTLGRGSTGKDFKLGSRNSAPSRQQFIAPTSSTSVYRFKLNRPTGRWRFKPSPKPKVNIIKTKEEEDLAKQKEILEGAHTQNEATLYAQAYNEREPDEIHTGEESRTESNELAQDFDAPELVPETIRVTTVTPTEVTDFEQSRIIEIATIRSPYVFQAGNVKNTRYITLTKTFTKDMIQPTQVVSPSFGNPTTLENILETRVPYERILEGSHNIATLPLIILGSDTATPPLETVTQTFSTTQLMLKTSILPVLYEGVTTLYTLTQSYLITRLVAAYKTVPASEYFHFAPTKSLTEFNTALQESGTEHREQLLGSETNDNEANHENIVSPPDELTLLGSDFDPSSMEDKSPRNVVKSQSKAVVAPKPKTSEPLAGGIPELSNLSPEQLAFLRYFASAGQQGQGLVPLHPQNYFKSPMLPSPQGQFPVAAAPSPLVINTVTTIVETKTLRIQFGSKPTHTIIYSTKIIPTKVTTFVTASVPPTAIPNFFQPHHPFPLAYVG